MFSGLLALHDLIGLMSASALWTTEKGQDEVSEEVALWSSGREKEGCI